MDDLAQLRGVFKRFNRFMLLIWRLGLGAWLNLWPSVGGRILVVVHRGRVTGLARRTPLNYALSGDDIYCTAGFGAGADWFRNILADPRVEVWLPDGWWAGLAEDVTGAEGYTERLRAVLINSGVVAPLFGIHPRTMSDDELMAVCADYRLVRIRRTEARTGPGGPGDLAWIWPAAAFALLLLALRPRRK